MLDASASLTLVLEDEDPGYATRLTERLASATAYVPLHWPLEATNGLLVAYRRGRMTLEATGRARELLLRLPIEIDDATGSQVWSPTFALAERYRLTTYDAAYLELAVRLNVTLATLDQGLADAARELGVRLFQ